VTPRAACRVEQLATSLVFSTRGAGLAGLGTLSRRTCCRWVVVAGWDGTRWDVRVRRRTFAGTPHTCMNNETYEGARRKQYCISLAVYPRTPNCSAQVGVVIIRAGGRAGPTPTSLHHSNGLAPDEHLEPQHSLGAPWQRRDHLRVGWCLPLFFCHSHSTSHPLHARTVLRSIYGDQTISHWHPSSSIEGSGSQSGSMSSETVRYQVSLK